MTLKKQLYSKGIRLDLTFKSMLICLFLCYRKRKGKKESIR